MPCHFVWIPHHSKCSCGLAWPREELWEQSHSGHPVHPKRATYAHGKPYPSPGLVAARWAWMPPGGGHRLKRAGVAKGWCLWPLHCPAWGTLHGELPVLWGLLPFARLLLKSPWMLSAFLFDSSLLWADRLAQEDVFSRILFTHQHGR